MARHIPGQPDRQYDPDAEFFRQYGVGCLVVFVAFLLLSGLIGWFWLR